MARKIRFGNVLVLLVTLILLLVSCFEQPVSPYKPSNTQIYLAIKSPTLHKNVDEFIDSVGNSVNIGIASNFPYYIDSISVKIYSPTNGFEDGKILKHIDSLKNSNDTVWYTGHFSSAGMKMIVAQAYVQENYKFSDTIDIKIVNKSVAAQRVKPHLLLGETRSISANQTCTLSVTAKDTNAAQMHSFYFKQDTMAQAIVFTPPFIWTPPVGLVGASTVFFKVTDSDSPSYFDTATITLTVLPVAIVQPAQPINVRALVKNGVVTIVWDSTASEDFIIFRSGSKTGTFTARDTVNSRIFYDTIGTLDYYYYVKASNGVDTSVASTSVFSRDLRSNAPHWIKDTVSLTGSEGSKLSLTLTDDCSGDSTMTFFIASNPTVHGDTIISSVFSYTLAMGDTNVYWPKIIAKDSKGNVDTMTLKLWAKKTDHDTIAPIVKHLIPASDSITVNSSTFKASVICKDQSGIASVKCSMGTDTFVTVNTSDSIWSATITSLVIGQFKTITFLAIDKSEKANKTLTNIYIKYDPSMTDSVGPIIAKVSGLVSGTRTPNPLDTFVYTITDPSMIDTVSWTLNGVSSGILTPDGNAKYSIITSFAKPHYNKIVITAYDKSTNHNKTSDTTNINYNRPPIISGAPDTTIQELSTIQFKVSATDPDSDKVKIIGSVLPTGASFDTATDIFKWGTVAGQKGANTVTFKAYDGLDTTTKTITITINDMPPPVITQNPADSSKCLGSSVSFSVAATGTGLTYRWKNAVNNLTEGHFKGTTTNTLSIPTIAASDAGTYSCVVTNSAGSTASSVACTLTVNSPSVAPTTVNAPTAVCNPGSADITFSGGSLGIGAHWALFSGGADLNVAATGNKFSIAGITSAKTYEIRAIGGSCDGSNAIKSSPIIIAVNTNVGASITSPTTAQDLCQGSSISFACTATGTGPFTYQWYKDAVPLGTNSSLDLTNLVPGNAGKYTCKVSGVCGNPVTTSAITVTIKPSPTISISPTSKNIIQGTTFTFTANPAGPTAYKYQWQKGPTTFTDIAGAINSTYATSEANIYKCVLTDGCGQKVTSSGATLSVTQTYAVTFNQNDNKATGSTALQTIASGASANLSANGFKKTGWTFIGWATAPAGNVSFADKANYTMGNSNVDLWAQWKPSGMVKILSAGKSFQMGEAGITHAEPVHTVSFTKSFWMDTSEVTQSSYLDLTGSNPSAFSGTNNPVDQVSWFDAILYCNNRSKREGLDTVYNYTSLVGAPDEMFTDFTKAGYRLPTEAEWEYACRGGTTSPDYWGNSSALGYAWYNSNSNNTTHSVGSKLPNTYGLYDMSGNVSEWCNDWDYTYTADPITDPTNDAGGMYRVIRGGSWESIGAEGSAYRNQSAPFNSWNTGGFRVVLPIK